MDNLSFKVRRALIKGLQQEQFAMGINYRAPIDHLDALNGSALLSSDPPVYRRGEELDGAAKMPEGMSHLPLAGPSRIMDNGTPCIEKEHLSHQPGPAAKIDVLEIHVISLVKSVEQAENLLPHE
jgi:hypothetical protein